MEHSQTLFTKWMWVWLYQANMFVGRGSIWLEQYGVVRLMEKVKVETGAVWKQKCLKDPWWQNWNIKPTIHMPTPPQTYWHAYSTHFEKWPLRTHRGVCSPSFKTISRCNACHVAWTASGQAGLVRQPGLSRKKREKEPNCESWHVTAGTEQWTGEDWR